jgi:hypothetical protein
LRTTSSEKSRNGKFFETFVRVKALNVEPRRDNEGVKLFLASRKQLNESLNSSSASEKADLHSILAIAELLQPAYPGFQRLENTISAHKHALACLESNEAGPEARTLALFVELRVLPVLIRSKAAPESELARSRERAFSTAESLNREKSLFGFLGILLEGVGFSYYQREGDRERALEYLGRAKSLLSKGGQRISPFFNAFRAIAFWDSGQCYESLADRAQGNEALRLYRQARLEYEKALKYAERSPWILYRAFAHLGIAATFSCEFELSHDSTLDGRRKLIEKAFEEAENGLALMNRYSSLEANMLGGTFHALVCQQYASVSKEVEPEKLLRRSGELAKKGLKAYKSASSRYSKANFGDVYFALAQFYHEKGKNNGVKELLLSLENCLQSQEFFDEERHAERALRALMLGAEVCQELASLGLQVKYYLNLAEKQIQKLNSIRERSGWLVHA